MRRPARAPAAGLLAAALALTPGCAQLPAALDAYTRVPAWEKPPPPAVDAPVVREGALTRERLANGLTVLVLEDPRIPRVSLGVTLRRGAGSEGPDEAGLAALTAEVMKRGAGDRDALALARAVDALGASLSVGTGWDSTTAQVSGLSRDLPALFDLLADVVRRPRLAADEVARAREEQAAALAQAVDDPSTLQSWYTARAVYPEHRYGTPVQGERDSVARLEARAVRDFHRRTFVPGNAIFHASGDVDAEDVLRRVRDAFGDWEPAEVPEDAPDTPDPAPEGRRILIVDRPDLGQTRISVAHEGIARTSDVRIPATLMNSVLGGGGFSSRLMDRVRADAGLTYGVWSGFGLRRRPGPFVVATFTRVPEARRVVDLLLAEIEKIREEPPTESELRDAKSLAVGRFAMELETSAAVMSSLVDLEVYDLPQDALDTYRGRVRAVTPEEAAESARQLLHPDRAALVLVGPAEALRPQLEDLGPIEVVTP